MVRRIARSWSWSLSWLIAVTVLALSLTMGTGASAANIIWVTESTDASNPPSPDDSGFTDLLTAQGHTVDRRNVTNLDAGQIAALEAADLVMVSRDTNSGNYTQGSEVADWNAISTPLIQMSQYLTRNNRWKWYNGGGTGGSSSDRIEAIDQTHPIFDGIALDAMFSAPFSTSRTPTGNTTGVGNGTPIGIDFGSGRPLITFWDTGTEFYSGAAQTAGGPRLFFGAGFDDNNPKGALNLTAEGEQIFLNAIEFLVPSAAVMTWDGTVNNYGTAHWIGPNPPPPPDFPDATIKALINAGQCTVEATHAALSMEITGGELVIGSGNTLDIAGALNSAPGSTVTLGNGSTLALGSGGIASLRTAGSATLDAAGAVSISGATFDDQGIPGTFVVQGGGTVTLDNSTGTGVIAGATTFQVNNGTTTLHAIGSDPLGGAAGAILDGGKLILEGAPTKILNQLNYGFYDNAASSNLQDIDDGQDNNANGGLFSLTPSPESSWPSQVQGKAVWTDEVWQGGNISDTYCQMWSGEVNVPAGMGGAYQVYVHGDDFEIFWLDVGQDGDFNTGVDDISRNIEGEEGWNTPHTETVTLVGGQSYDFAIAHREGGGGDNVNVTITDPIFNSTFRINPSDPTQAGLWSTSSPGAINMTTPITVLSDSELQAISALPPANIASITLDDTPGNGVRLTTSGADMVVANFAISGGAGREGTLVVENENVEVITYNDGNIDTTFGKAGQGTLKLDNTAGLISAPNTTYRVDAGTLHGTGADLLGGPPEVILNGGELLVEGAPVTVGAIAHYGYHINNDGVALDLHNNGGMMGGGDPTLGPSYYGQAVLTDGPDGNGLEFDNDGEFTSTGAIGQNDNYSNLWVGMLHVDAANAGKWEFRHDRSDDRAGIWLDLDQDGVFESSSSGLGNDRGEQLRWEFNATETVPLTPGDYLMAFTHREGGGGSNVDFFVKSPTMSGQEIIKPTAVSQFGIWAPIPFAPAATLEMPGPIDMTDTDITVTAPDSRLTAISYGGADFGTATVHDGASLITGGDTPEITFTQAILPGGRGTYKPEVPTILTRTSGLSNPGGVPSTLVAAGTSDLILNQPPADSMANVTLEGKSGRLVADYANGDPTGGANIVLTGGTFAAKGGYDPNAVVPNAINHYGYHINNDGAVLDLHNNGGMMGGGDPTNGPSYFGQARLTDGPDGNGLEFDNDNEFANTGAVSQQDNYSSLWVGTLHVDAANAGDWEFRQNRSDDRAGIWLDLDQDGVFESSSSGLGSNRGEQLRWENNSTATVPLTAGDYLMAFTHREGGGGSNVDFFVKSPTMGGEEVIQPTAAGQAGLWSAVGGIGALDLQNTLTVDNQPASALRHLGYHINNDGLALDLNNNAGMMGGGVPTSFQNFYGEALLTDGPGGRGLDFDDDNDFINTGAIGQTDNYSNLWLATLHVSAANAGQWEFQNNGDDDRGGIWLDLDQDGIFESTTPGLGSDRGEQLSWEDGGWKAVTLAEGEYLIAFTHREGGGGSRADFTFRHAGITGGSEWDIRPSDAAQAGLWSTTPTSTLELITDVGANLRELILKNGDLLITGGPGLTVEQASIHSATSGTVGLITQTNTILTDVIGFNGNGQTVEIAKSGSADLILNKAGSNLGGATFIAKDGRLIGVHDLGNPFGAAALEQAGGEVVLSSAGGDVPYDNAVHVTQSSILTAGQAANGVAGPLTVTLGSPGNGITIDPGVTSTMRAISNYSLDVAGPLNGGNLLIPEGTVALNGGGSVAQMGIVQGTTASTPGVAISEHLQLGAGGLQVGVTGGSFTVSGTDLLDSRTIALDTGGAAVTVANTAYGAGGVKGLNIYSDDNSNGDTTIDPISNLFSQSDLTFEGVLGTYDNDDLPDNGDLDIGDFHHDQWAGLTHDDNFSVLFEGVFVAPAKDDYSFGTASDDGSTCWIDLDRSGTFEHDGLLGDEMIVDNKGAHGRQERTGTVNLEAGAYLIATAIEERGGGDNMEAKWAQGAGVSYGSQAFINASGPFWTATAPPSDNPIDATSTNIIASADSTLFSDTVLTAAYGDLILGNGATLTLTGAPGGISFANVIGDGTVIGTIASAQKLVAPGGDGIGKITMQGDLTFAPAPDGVFEADVAGFADDQHDWMAFVGTGNNPILNGAFLDLLTPLGTFSPGDISSLLTLMELQDDQARVDGFFTDPDTGLALANRSVFFDGNEIYTWRIDYFGGTGGNDVVLELMTIPEPTTLVLLGLGALGLIRRRRRRA